MLKKDVFLLFILLCFILACKPARAELLKKGQSSEQVFTYDQAEEGNVAQEAPQPYMGGIEEYPYTGPDPTLRENATDDSDFQSYPYPDYPADDPGMTEVPITDSAGPDTTLREKATDDSGMQEYADPYGPTPDLFGPKRNVGSGA